MHIASAINPLDKSDGNVPVSVFCYNNQRRFLFVSQSYEACCIINRTFTLSLTHDVGNYWASGKRLPDSKPKFHSPSNVVPTFLSRTKCYHRSKRLPVLMAFHWRDWGGNNRRFCYWRYVWIFRVYHLETYISLQTTRKLKGVALSLSNRPPVRLQERLKPVPLATLREGHRLRI